MHATLQPAERLPRAQGPRKDGKDACAPRKDGRDAGRLARTGTDPLTLRPLRCVTFARRPAYSVTILRGVHLRRPASPMRPVQPPQMATLGVANNPASVIARSRKRWRSCICVCPREGLHVPKNLSPSLRGPWACGNPNKRCGFPKNPIFASSIGLAPSLRGSLFILFDASPPAATAIRNA